MRFIIFPFVIWLSALQVSTPIPAPHASRVGYRARRSGDADTAREAVSHQERQLALLWNSGATNGRVLATPQQVESIVA